MKSGLYLSFCLGLMLSNCTTTSHRTNNFKCEEEPMPEYDYRATAVGEMTPQLDSLLRIEKKREIFKPCRIYVFDAEFYSSSAELISKEKISLMATGKRWEHQPEKQDEVQIRYHFDEESIERVNSHQLNKKLVTDQWRQDITTGIIENVEKIWMHPFRANQYNFTEVAPFPQVEFPLNIGKTWTDNHIHLREGWGDWSTMKVKSSFEVLALETVRTEYGEMANCWKISGISNFPLGHSKITYWFHEKFGFVKLHYDNYGGQKLKIELSEIEENNSRDIH